MDAWECPNCGITNRNPDGPRVMIIRKEWDFCKKCGYPRPR